MENRKSAIVVDGALPLGVQVNTAAILGITLGKLQPEVVGADVVDGAGREHRGIIEFPVPILRGDEALLRDIRERLYDAEFAEVTVVDFSETAQSCKSYPEFIGKIEEESELRYFGILLCGEKKKVNKLTGSLPLLR